MSRRILVHSVKASILSHLSLGVCVSSEDWLGGLLWLLQQWAGVRRLSPWLTIGG